MCGSIIIARSVEYKSVFCWLDMHEENTTTMDLLYEKKNVFFEICIVVLEKVLSLSSAKDLLLSFCQRRNI